jgi:hypothetical protein
MMSQRDSGYERRQLDLYETPAWVTRALVPHLPVIVGAVWEPAAGSGQMVAALRAAGFAVHGTDIATGRNFLDSASAECAAIITNPPYTAAKQFIEHALKVMTPGKGVVAMLLRTDFDHAKTRQHLFGGCAQFAKKLVLTKRIVWFDGPKAAPSFNHAWYLWDWKHCGPPTLVYGP